MHIVLGCATRRGLLALRRVRELCPSDALTVASFPEDPGEPPYLDSLREEAAGMGSRLLVGKRLGTGETAELFVREGVDLLILIHWRYLLPRPVIERARVAAVAIHDSLLPRYRGFSPVVWAMLNGEAETGATLFHIEEEMDSGDIIDQRRVPIGGEEAVAEVMENVTAAYLDLLAKNLELLKTGRAPRRAQDESQATYACKRASEDNQIRWELPAEAVHRAIRALSAPYPGAFTLLRGRRLIVWKASIVRGRPYAGKVPGAVAEVRPGRGAVVLTGTDPLLLEIVELEGEGPRPAADVLKSLRIRLGNPR